MKLPREILGPHFEDSFKRGAVIRFLMTDLNDPSITRRQKFAVVIGLDGEGNDSFLLLATSRVEKVEPIRKRVPEAFHAFEVGDYSWVSKPTLLDLRQARPYSRDELKQKMIDECLTFECYLSEREMQEIDAKLRVSPYIEIRTLKRIVSGVD